MYTAYLGCCIHGSSKSLRLTRIIATCIVLHLFWEPLYLFRSAQWACECDVPRILEPCMTALPMYSYIISNNMKAQLIWSYASCNGSTRVLTWFLENTPDLMKYAIPRMYCENTKTVKWCIENLCISPPAPVNWVMMKACAIVENNIDTIDLLDWVTIPPCPLDDANCGNCPACMIRNNYINLGYFFFRNLGLL
jgi:hypothetical protein